MFIRNSVRSDILMIVLLTGTLPISALALSTAAAVDLAAANLAEANTSRRSWTRQALLTTALACGGKLCASPLRALAATSSLKSWSDVMPPIREATETLEKLVQNWEKAVIDCTYADVPRELLQQKNKALLLEKASTFALFDKSVSVVSCKTVVSTVRDYLGRTGIGPVADLDKALKAAITLLLREDTMEMDAVESIVQTVEDVQRALSRADSLSYSARRDFSAMNNFDPAQSSSVLSADPASNLQQSKAAIETAIDKLRILLRILPSE